MDESTTPTPRQWLTTQQAMERLQVSRATLHRWIAAGNVPVHRTPGGRPRFDAAELDAVITRDEGSEKGALDEDPSGD